MRPAPAAVALLGLLAAAVPAQAQLDPHHGHHQHHQMGAPAPAPAAGSAPTAAPVDHSAHIHEVGPAGLTYDLRWLDAMVQHHTGALRMSEFVFDIGQPGVGALAKQIWRDQAQEINAMGQWRKAWYPEAPVYPVALKTAGNPNSMDSLERMGAAHIEAMRMMGSKPSRDNRVSWFLDGMLAHHGGALVMAHDALKKSTNPSIQRLARDIIVAQRREIIELRRMLRQAGLNKPAYHQFDALFSY
jgi:uncharacterized protein (DUF305 family)